MPKTVKKTDTILALDPGLQDLGYAVLSGRKLVTAGVLPLRTILRRRRLGKVRESIEALIRAYGPRTLVWEHIPKRPLDQIADPAGARPPARSRCSSRRFRRLLNTVVQWSPQTNPPRTEGA